MVSKKKPGLAEMAGSSGKQDEPETSYARRQGSHQRLHTSLAKRTQESNKGTLTGPK